MVKKFHALYLYASLLVFLFSRWSCYWCHAKHYYAWCMIFVISMCFVSLLGMSIFSPFLRFPELDCTTFMTCGLFAFRCIISYRIYFKLNVPCVICLLNLLQGTMNSEEIWCLYFKRRVLFIQQDILTLP